MCGAVLLCRFICGVAAYIKWIRHALAASKERARVKWELDGSLRIECDRSGEWMRTDWGGVEA